jgi:hypothetical protein
VAEQKLPKAIQAEIELAEQIQKSLEPPASEDGNTGEENPADNTPPATSNVIESENTTETAPTPNAEEQSWKTKYDVLSGKYNAEVPKLHEQVQNTVNALHALQQEIDQLKAKPQAEKKPPQSHITAKDEETFGGDLIDLARRVVKDEISGLISDFSHVKAVISTLTDLPNKVKTVETKQQLTEEELFWADVAKQIPNWQAIDADPLWIEFLANKPAFTSRTYRELAIEAIAQGQVAPLVELVKVWEDATGQTSQKEEQSKKQKELNSQVAPTKGKTTTNTPAETGRIWSGEEYSKAFDPRLTRTMQKEELETLQAEAEKAYVEGRIKW